MASEAELMALASACEQASGADRSIDYAIGYLEGEHNHPPEMWQYIMPKSKVDNSCPRYTASLDAAMALVPETCSFGMEAYSPDHNTLGWTVHIRYDANLRSPNISAFASTFALALCAAALKARAATMGGSDD